MRTIAFMVAVMTGTVGCSGAFRTGIPSYGTNFGEIRSDRPSVADALRGGQTSIGSFASNPAHCSVPQDIPLPSEANPRHQFAMPELGDRTVNQLFQTAGIIVTVLCSIPDPFEAPDRGCEARTQRSLERDVPRPVTQKGPVILR